jgi:hypothetical protein
MQKHKFSVTHLGAHFVETALGHPEHEKLCIDISRPGSTEMHYGAQTLHLMQKNTSSA